MEMIWQGILTAFKLLLAGDPEIIEITLLTLRVSCTGTLISVLIGIPLGTLLALKSFPGRRFLLSLANAGMGLPPVVVGLWVSIFLWRSGPFGFLNIMYTPTAIVIAQAILAAPVVAALTAAALQQTDPKIRLQIQALGANRRQYVWLLLKEIRYSLMAAIIAGFGTVVSEVGASMAVGGNIHGQTRVLTTATVLEISKGQFGNAIALSIILCILAYSATMFLTILQQKQQGGS